MDKIKEFGDSVYDYVMAHFNDPMFWIIIFTIVLIIMYTAIKDFGNK